MSRTELVIAAIVLAAAATWKGTQRIVAVGVAVAAFVAFYQWNHDPAPAAPPTAAIAEPAECSDFVADLPSCAEQVAARGGCDVYMRGEDGQERLAIYTLADGTVVEEIGVDTWTEPAGCDPTRYTR